VTTPSQLHHLPEESNSRIEELFWQSTLELIDLVTRAIVGYRQAA